MSLELPELPGLLSAAEIKATAATIVAMQEPTGAIPWTTGQHTDVWNHVESAMALLIAGEVEAAEHALRWCAETQRPDGTWPMRFVHGVIEDASAETNMSAYLAVGLWHHWLVRADLAFVSTLWPTVRRALDWVVEMQLAFGGFAWSKDANGRVNFDSLLAGSSSIYQALRAGIALCELHGEEKPQWELAGGKLGHALRTHRDLFLDKSTFSMDWYYPVLGGAVRGAEAEALLLGRWDDFVVPGLGVRCVDSNSWVTGAESCELVLTLEAVGDHNKAREIFANMQHLRDTNGAYWTGLVFPSNVNWPAEHTTYTAAAVILAADALSDLTPGADIMRGNTLPSFAERALTCGCIN
jgi:hypothetical protein